MWNIQCYIQNTIQFCVARCRCVASETDLRVGLLFRTHKKFLESFVPLTRYIIHNTKILSKLFSFFLKLFILNTIAHTHIHNTHEHIVTHCILYINILIIVYNIHYLMYKYTHYSRKNYPEIQSENQL